MAQGNHETEIKLAVSDAREARKRVLAAGFEVSRERVLERNIVFDTPDLALRKSSRLLRLRQAARDITLTYKGVPTTAKHKSREELEVQVADFDGMCGIICRLGFQVTFRYEKYRTEFRQPRRAGVAMLDETPLGVCLELEGTPHWIDRIARKLGFDEDAYITASYGRLFQEWRTAHQSKSTDMTFS